MKLSLFTLLLLSTSTAAFAKNIDCKGASTYAGAPAMIHITYNDKDGLVVEEGTLDGSSAAKLSSIPKNVEHWKEDGVEALGRKNGLKIYLLSDKEATLRRLSGYGTSAENGDFTSLACE